MRASNDYRAAGAHDVVVLAMKAHQLGAVADDVPPLCGPQTVDRADAKRHPVLVLPQTQADRSKATRCKASTQSGRIGRAIDADNVLGCVVYPASELVAPGVVRHIEGDRFPLGELDGSSSARAQRVSDAFVRRRLQGAAAGRHPRRDLAQAVGQPDVQPGQQP